MKPSPPILYDQLTEGELRELLGRGMDALLLPVGATEQHGPHLSTGTDSAIASILCREASSRTGVPVLPTLPYGCSIGHSHH